MIQTERLSVKSLYLSNLDNLYSIKYTAKINTWKI